MYKDWDDYRSDAGTNVFISSFKVVFLFVRDNGKKISKKKVQLKETSPKRMIL